MDIFSYRVVNVPQILMREFPQGSASDDVVISVYDLTAATQDVTLATMTNVIGSLYKYSWTPTLSDHYFVDYFNRTLGVHEFDYIKATSSIVLG